MIGARLARVAVLAATTGAATTVATGCEGAVGTIALELTTAPGSTVLDGVDRLRLTITNPRRVFEAVRADGGFDLSIEFDAIGEAGALVVEGFDASGGLAATGMSPPFVLAPTDARIVIYVAPPMSIAPAAVSLGPPRAGVAGTALSYGAVFAGGLDGAGVPSTALAIYNGFDHSLVGGLAMPLARTGIAIGATAANNVYLHGGTTADGNPDGTLLRFDTSVQPNGGYVDLGAQPGLARTAQRAIRIGADRFLLTGSPPADLSAGVVSARTDLATLPATGAVRADGTSVFADPTAGLVRFRADGFEVLPGAPPPARTALVALRDGRFVVIGGGDATTPSLDATLVDADAGTVTSVVNALATGRYDPAIASTSRHVVISGGVDVAGTPLATAEVLDATTLAHVATIPVTPRAGAFAIALANDQVLIAGGDAATDLLELFTPPPPE